jgi:cyclopropane-fatty-acyl-phospholipid synthase
MHGRKEVGKAMALRVILPVEATGVLRYQFDLPSEFYALLLGGSMASSCAYFRSPDNDLETAQGQMLDYSCRKLRVRAGERILDLGCGWGAWMLYSARRYRARVFGTNSNLQQAEFARDQFRFAGVADRCKVEVRDYHDLDPPTEYDKIVSLGMSEDIPLARLPEYFQRTFSLLMPGGVFLKNAMATLAPGQDSSPSVRDQYTHHDTERPSLSTMVRTAEAAGFEIRDVENLREHCALTLDRWLSNLESNVDRARQIAGDATYRTWRLRIASSARAIRAGRAGFYQILCSKPKRGASGLPLTRADGYR